MKAEERRKYIMDVANHDGTVSIPATAEHFKVSIETIRRDINVLCAENKLRKIHGGAVPVKRPLRRDTDYLSRIASNQQSKITIGAEAAKLISDGDVVMLDCGVSIQGVAASVMGVREVTFITNSVPTASILLEKYSLGHFTGRIILVGGELNCGNRFSTGALAVDALCKYYADKAFISCTAVSSDGVSSSDTGECGYSEALIRRSASSVLIAESEKFGKNSVYRFASLRDFSMVITDGTEKLPEDIIISLEEASAVLIIAQ